MLPVFSRRGLEWFAVRLVGGDDCRQLGVKNKSDAARLYFPTASADTAAAATAATATAVGVVVLSCVDRIDAVFDASLVERAHEGLQRRARAEIREALPPPLHGVFREVCIAKQLLREMPWHSRASLLRFPAPELHCHLRGPQRRSGSSCSTSSAAATTTAPAAAAAAAAAAAPSAAACSSGRICRRRRGKGRGIPGRGIPGTSSTSSIGNTSGSSSTSSPRTPLLAQTFLRSSSVAFRRRRHVRLLRRLLLRLHQM